MANRGEDTRPKRVRRALPDKGHEGDEFENVYRDRRGVGRNKKIAGAFVAILLLLLAGDAAYVASNLASNLRSAHADINAGYDRLRVGDLANAKEHFRQARSSARVARSLAVHPAPVMASVVPFLYRDADAVEALPEVAELVADAGLEAVAAGESIGGTTPTELADAFLDEGRVQIETIESLTDSVRAIDDNLARADEMLGQAPDPSLEVVDRAIDRASEELTAARGTVGTGRELLESLPSLLGGNGTRRYLLTFQNLSEARATGGSLGIYGVLEADDGVVTLAHAGPMSELSGPLEDRVFQNIAARTPALRRYRTRVIRQKEVNFAPDFEATSEALLTIYEEATGTRLDGVFMTDPVALGEFTRATGPITGIGMDKEIGPSTAVEVMLHDAYAEFGPRQEDRIRFLVSVTRNFYEALNTSLDAPKFVQAMATAAADGHVRIYSAEPGDAAALERLGVAGTLPNSGNVQLVFHNNLAANGTDYFIRRSLDTEVSITEQGDLDVKLVIDLENTAPAGPSDIGTSITGRYPPGVNAMELNAVLPTAAVVDDLKVDGASRKLNLTDVVGFPNVWTDITLQPGEKTRVQIDYAIPGATDLLKGGAFQFITYPASGVRGEPLKLTFVPPPGYEVSSADGGKRTGAGSLAFTSNVTRTIYDLRVEGL